MRVSFYLFLFIANLSISQNSWPKSYAEPLINLQTVIEDYDGGFLVMASINNQGYAYLLKFDANGNKLWKKCIHNLPKLISGNRFIKDKFNMLYIVGSVWDSAAADPNAFILKLDSCYEKTKCIIYGDTSNHDQQYFVWNNDFNDSLFFASGWGFDNANNQMLIINKSDLLPKKIYNTKANSSGNSLYKSNHSVYMTLDDYFYLKNGDTGNLTLRTTILKLNEQTGDKVFYKFLGFDENLITVGYNIFKNINGDLFVFSTYYQKINDTTSKAFTPMLYKCDTNGNLINYRVYNDKKINQAFNSAIQFNDSTYFIAVTYLDWGSSGFAIEKIKLYKLDGDGVVVDSFYIDNWGRKFFTKAGMSYVNLIKTFDNHIMCVFPELDTDFTNPRITFIKFDDKFKLDTTEYRNKIYDSGCLNLIDSISLADASFYHLHTDNTYPVLKLSRPTEIIKVPTSYITAFYPNPIKTLATFEFESIYAGEVSIDLYDTRGIFVKKMIIDQSLNRGNNKISINFDSISSGQYYIKVFYNGEIKHTIKVIKE